MWYGVGGDARGCVCVLVSRPVLYSPCKSYAALVRVCVPYLCLLQTARCLMVLYCRSPRRLPQCTTIPGTVVEHIDLSDNQLSGTLSTQLGSFARLLYVRMRTGLVTTLFTVADWWRCLLVSVAFSRRYLNLSYNRFMGTVPESLECTFGLTYVA